MARDLDVRLPEKVDHICESCGQTFSTWYDRNFLCPACEQKQAKPGAKRKTGEALPPVARERRPGRYSKCGQHASPRKCHDCGKPTFDYRCPAC